MSERIYGSMKDLYCYGSVIDDTDGSISLGETGAIIFLPSSQSSMIVHYFDFSRAIIEKTVDAYC